MSLLILIATLKTSLPNGVLLLHRRTPGTDILAASLVFPVGVEEEGELWGIRNVVVKALLRHANGASARLEATGGTFSASLGMDHIEFFAVTRRQYASDALSAITVVASPQEIEPSTIEEAKREALKEVEALERSPTSQALALLRRGLFGPHPYGRPVEGTEESIKRITPDAVVKFIREHLSPSRALLGLACDLPSDEALTLVQATLGAVPSRPAPSLSLLPFIPAAPANDLEVRETSGNLARVLVGFLVPPPTHPDYPAVQVLAALLGGGMGSELAKRLREGRGLAYEVSCECPLLKGPSYLALYASTEPPLVDEVLAQMLSLVAEVRKGRIVPTDFLRARQYALGQMLLKLQRVREIAFHIALWEALGLGADYDRVYPRQIEGVSPRRLLEVARKYLAHFHALVTFPSRAR